MDGNEQIFNCICQLMKQVICTFNVQISLLCVCQAVKQLLELPLNLTIVSPAHTPNWDLVSDVVNSCSRIYRSPKQCRNRYENVIIPREEGKVMDTESPSFAVKLAYSPCTCLSKQCVTFFSWCMKQTPRRKPRAYTRYPILVFVFDKCFFALDFLASLLFFLYVSTLSLRTAAL